MSNKLVCLQPCPIYWCIHSQSWTYKDGNHTREKEKQTNHIDENFTIYQLVRYLKKLLVWLSYFLFVSSFSFLFTHFLLLVLCQTHSFLMEFQNASYIVKVRERVGEGDGAVRTHTLTNIFIILSHFFFFFVLLLQQLFSLSFQLNGRLPVFQNTYTYTGIDIEEKWVQFIIFYNWSLRFSSIISKIELERTDE